MNAPRINCPCGKIMVVKQQENYDNGRVKLLQECVCGNAAKTLLYPKEGRYDVYITNEKGELLKYYNETDDND